MNEDEIIGGLKSAAQDIQVRIVRLSSAIENVNRRLDTVDGRLQVDQESISRYREERLQDRRDLDRLQDRLGAITTSTGEIPKTAATLATIQADIQTLKNDVEDISNNTATLGVLSTEAAALRTTVSEYKIAVNARLKKLEGKVEGHGVQIAQWAGGAGAVLGAMGLLKSLGLLG